MRQRSGTGMLPPLLERLRRRQRRRGCRSARPPRPAAAAGPGRGGCRSCGVLGADHRSMPCEVARPVIRLGPGLRAPSPQRVVGQLALERLLELAPHRRRRSAPSRRSRRRWSSLRRAVGHAAVARAARRCRSRLGCSGGRRAAAAEPRDSVKATAAGERNATAARLRHPAALCTVIAAGARHCDRASMPVAQHGFCTVELRNGAAGS